MSAVAERFSRARCGTLGATLLACFIYTSAAWAEDREVMSGSVAAAIREAGYPCAHVIQMDRSKEGAAEGYTAWDVSCNSGRFKVTFKGDTGSEVVPLD